MKKLIALLLALMMVLVSVTALAAGEPDPETGDGGGNVEVVTPTAYQPGDGSDDGTDTEGNPRLGQPLDNGGSITIDKVYTLLILEGAKLPKTDITFTAELTDIAKSTVKVADMASKKVTISYTPADETELSATATKFTDTNKITIQFPEYPEVGVYTYKVTESGTALAGVTYSDEIKMKVTVVRLNGVLKIAGVAFRIGDSGKKLQEITNKYEAGTLTVEKTVTGNMGEQDRDFEITVTLSSTKKVNSTIGVAVSGNGDISSGVTDNTIPAGWTGEKTVKFTLRHTDKITFTNVPAGVTYAISEKSYADLEYDAAVYSNASGTIVAGEPSNETVTNNRNMEIDTGVSLDSTVYMMIMALALAGFVALKIRRREEN